MLSINSREAISLRKWDPPFLTQVSVSCVDVRVSKMDEMQNGRSLKCERPSYVESAELCVGVLVTDAPFQRSHGLLGRHSLGPDNIGYLQVERNIFPTAFMLVYRGRAGMMAKEREAPLQATASRPFNLLVQGRVGRGRPPAHHVEERFTYQSRGGNEQSMTRKGLPQEKEARKQLEGWNSCSSVCGRDADRCSSRLLLVIQRGAWKPCSNGANSTRLAAKLHTA